MVALVMGKVMVQAEDCRRRVMVVIVMVIEEVIMHRSGFDGMGSIESCVWFSGGKILVVMVVLGKKKVVLQKDFDGGGDGR